MKASTLLIFAHGTPNTSRVNQQLLSLAQKLPNVYVHDISSTYIDYQISVEQELDLLSAHENIVLQFPLYWYSMPAILKAWMDTVCSAPAVMTRGGILSGKSIKALATAGSDLGRLSMSLAFTEQSIFWPIEQTAHHLEMQWLPPKILNDVSKWSDARLARETCDYLRWLSPTTCFKTVDTSI